jgi:uncharacterized delta-60 repeat protein
MTRKPLRRNHARSTSIFEPLEPRQLMSGGELDTTFNRTGSNSIAPIATGVHYTASDVAVQADGKSVVTGTSSSANLTQFMTARFNTDGTLDKTFGPHKDGIVYTAVGGSRSEANAVAIQPDGKIVVVGSSGEYGGKFAVVRYNSDGSLDNSFDADGKKTFSIKDHSNAYAVALQTDGKILIAGGDTNGNYITSAHNEDFAVARLNSNGSFDLGFGWFGKATIAMGADENVNAIAIDYTGAPSTNPHFGKIVLVGQQCPDNLGPPTSIVMARLNSNGRRDYSFGDLAGAADTEYVVTRFPNHRDSSASSVLMQPDGKIVIAGTTGDNYTGPSLQFALARYLPSGKLDKTFGTSGTGLVETGTGGMDRGFDLVQSRDGGLILGGLVDSNFALAAYDANGRLNTAFGDRGKVRLPVGQAGSMGLALTPDQRLVIAGGSDFTVARAFQFRPTVEIHGHYSIASETPGHNGSVVLTRDSATLPLRVFFNIGGTATLNADYTYRAAPTYGASAMNFNLGSSLANIFGGGLAGGGANVIGGGVGGIIGGGGVITTTFTPYVDFAAGQTSATITLDIKQDALLEPAETATFTLVPDLAYTNQSGRGQATVGINDDDEVHVNFQTANRFPPPGYVADLGSVFGDRGSGLSYGWDADNTANARSRYSAGSPDPRYDTYNHMQKNGANRKWEIAVPNGLYQVRLVAGDPGANDSIYRMNLEYSSAMTLSARPTGDVRWFRSTITVPVNDGRLTLTNAPGALNNKIAFIDIKAAPYGASAENVANLDRPVRLYSQTTSSLWTRKPNGLFSDNQIDEPLWA